jgi:hypothetical protein
MEAGCGRLGRADVEDGPDRWAPPVSWRVREEVVKVGRRWLLGRKGVVGLLRKKEKGMGGLLGSKEEGIEVWFWLFFSFLFLFQPFTQKSFQVFKNYFKNFLNHTTKLKPMHST